MLIQPPASEINCFHVWLHMLSSSLQRESTAAWHTYHWIPFPNNHQAPSKGELPPHPDPLSHNRHYLSVPWISSFRNYLKGSTIRYTGISKLYCESCCQETKTSFRTSKATTGYNISRTEHEQIPWHSPSPTPAGPHTSFCSDQHKGALCSHKMVCKICSEHCPPSHYKNRQKIGSALLLASLCLLQS